MRKPNFTIFRSVFSKVRWLARLWPILLIAGVIANSFFLYRQQQSNFRVISQSTVRDADIEELSDRIDEAEGTLREIKEDFEQDQLDQQGIKRRVDAIENDLLMAEDNTNRKFSAIDRKISDIEFSISSVKLSIDGVKSDIMFMKECTQSRCSYHFSLISPYRF